MVERSSEFGVRCTCGHLNKPPSRGSFCVCAKCDSAFPFRTEQRTFYVTGAPEAAPQCTCDFCEGRMYVEPADFFSSTDGGE